jgi:beta-glucosidase
MRRWVALISFALAGAALGAQPQTPIYKDAAARVGDRVADLVGRMTLEEKFWQLYMIPGDLDDPANDYSHGVFGLQVGGPTVTDARSHAERINAIQKYFVEQTRLGIPIMPFEEALHGLKAPGATVFPQAIGLAATWDVALMRGVADAAAAETRARGIRDALSPVINIADDVRWGRVEETYGEDPYLSSEMARAFVSAFESAGVVATPKHFIANDGDGGRDSYPVFANERMLMERYFPPFQAAIGAGAQSVMTAYNSVDGAPATQNPRLLNEILKRDWKFGGFVISDAAATGGATVLHMTEPSTTAATAHALASGLDVIFQSSYSQYRPYWSAFERGLIPTATIDAAVARVLRAKFELGLFEHPYVDAAAAAVVNGSAEHIALARAAARASMVLLKNGKTRLPISLATSRIAVIGGDATEGRLGGYSGPGIKVISILDGIRAAVRPGTTVTFTPGPGRVIQDLVTIPGAQFSTSAGGKDVRGLSAEYFDNNALSGAPRLSRVDPRADFRWTLNAPGRGIPFDWFSARWTSTLTAPAAAVRRIAVEGNDGYRLWLDGHLIIDNWVKRSYGTRDAAVNLAAGTKHALRLEYFESTGNARLKLLWNAGATTSRAAATKAIATAAAAAANARIAVVVAGLEEGEFRDRSTLALPGAQKELIRRVAATGTPVVVVLVGGSAITMSSWIDKVDAVLDVWYPGEQGGNAVADVLFGGYNPAGRLPVTFAMSDGQLPLSYNHKPTGRGDDYLDLTGMALFPFGYGLSYSTFEYSDLTFNRTEIGANETAIVRCMIRNTSNRRGDEVAQLYIRDVVASLARPVIELEGFQRVSLSPGESKTLTFTLGPEQLKMLNDKMQWVVEPGDFRVMIGASSKDIRLRGFLRVKKLFQILLKPRDPAPLHVALMHGIGGVVAGDRIRDELRGDAVVDQRVVQLVGFRDGHAVVADVVQDQRRRLDLARVRDRRLLPHALHRVGVHPRRVVAAAPAGRVAEVVLVELIGDRRARDRGFPDVIVAEHPGRHVAAVRPARNGHAGVVDEAALF